VSFAGSMPGVGATCAEAARGANVGSTSVHSASVPLARTREISFIVLVPEEPRLRQCCVQSADRVLE
jgi:hypothetical protein